MHVGNSSLPVVVLLVMAWAFQMDAAASDIVLEIWLTMTGLLGWVCMTSTTETSPMSRPAATVC